MSMVDELRPEYFCVAAEEAETEDAEQENDEAGSAYLYDADDSGLEWYQK